MLKQANNEGCKFAAEMMNAERDTLLLIIRIAQKYNVEPFQTIDCFIEHLSKSAKMIKEDLNNKGGKDNEFV